MKRDKDLILKILRWVRDTADGRKALDAPDCNGHDRAVVRYHVRLCHEAGFIDSVVPGDGEDIRIRALTWTGHEHLDANYDC